MFSLQSSIHGVELGKLRRRSLCEAKLSRTGGRRTTWKVSGNRKMTKSFVKQNCHEQGGTERPFRCLDILSTHVLPQTSFCWILNQSPMVGFIFIFVSYFLNRLCLYCTCTFILQHSHADAPDTFLLKIKSIPDEIGCVLSLMERIIPMNISHADSISIFDCLVDSVSYTTGPAAIVPQYFTMSSAFASLSDELSDCFGWSGCVRPAPWLSLEAVYKKCTSKHFTGELHCSLHYAANPFL